MILKLGCSTEDDNQDQERDDIIEFRVQRCHNIVTVDKLGGDIGCSEGDGHQDADTHRIRGSAQCPSVIDIEGFVLRESLGIDDCLPFAECIAVLQFKWRRLEWKWTNLSSNAQCSSMLYRNNQNFQTKQYRKKAAT